MKKNINKAGNLADDFFKRVMGILKAPTFDLMKSKLRGLRASNVWKIEVPKLLFVLPIVSLIATVETSISENNKLNFLKSIIYK